MLKEKSNYVSYEFRFFNLNEFIIIVIFTREACFITILTIVLLSTNRIVLEVWNPQLNINITTKIFLFSVLLQTLLGGAAVTASAAADGQLRAADTLSRLSDMGRGKRSTSFAVESSTSGGLELSQCLSHRIEAIVSRTASGSVSGCQARPTVIALPAPQAWMINV